MYRKAIEELEKREIEPTIKIERKRIHGKEVNIKTLKETKDEHYEKRKIKKFE